ncbi:MAG TPA: hypothetical protein VK957_08030 [Lunatimonas sp.]|nr:hypothetical protein [Lunatimonas sp.]
MLQFFKVNDPFRLLGILLFVVLLRLPYIWLDMPLLQPEMIWMLIGERLVGDYAMYSQIMDDTGPLSALVYWALYSLFGRSLWAYHGVAGIIILFQVIYLNFLFIRFKSFQENSYLPAIVMLALFHLSYDFLILSPSLMGNTFILLAFGQLFSHTNINRNSTESVLLLGLYGGFALCFHFPLVVFFPFMVICGVFISGFNFQQLSLSVTSYFIPVSMYAVYTFWTDSLGDFYREFVLASRQVAQVVHVPYNEILILFAFPIILSLIGLVLTFGLRKMYVNQQKQSQLIVIYFICSCCAVFLANRTITYQFLGLVPVFTYYLVHLLWVSKRKYKQRVIFYAYLLIIPLIGYGWLYLKKNEFEAFSSYAIIGKDRHQIQDGARVLVLGKDLGYYQNAVPATPFINIGLAKQYLHDMEDYGKKTKVFRHFMEESPQFIIDEEGVFAQILPYFPQLEQRYELVSDGIYQLKIPANR